MSIHVRKSKDSKVNSNLCYSDYHTHNKMCESTCKLVTHPYSEGPKLRRSHTPNPLKKSYVPVELKVTNSEKPLNTNPFFIKIQKNLKKKGAYGV